MINDIAPPIVLVTNKRSKQLFLITSMNIPSNFSLAMQKLRSIT